jgi:BlaI family penicillinase repressor
MKQIPDLSRAEYDILNIIWPKGRLSIREVHDELQSTYQWAYSTTKTMMDRMVQKGHLQREEFHRVFLYKPLITKPQGLARWVQFFADRVLGMDYSSVVSLFANNNSLTENEIDELKELLNSKEKDK